ncbi:histone methyltransferase [Abeliophyllum distichum]|uniref:Histone methyltransferase n=1 Tax=Abeliophyllum distichum TaxID=126358 RepID=A0ABD1SCC6_9LAMI
MLRLMVRRASPAPFQTMMIGEGTINAWNITAILLFRILLAIQDLITTCTDNKDKNFADCSIPQEKSNAEINKELDISDASCEEDAYDAFMKSKQNQSTVAQHSSWMLIKSNLFLHRSRKNQTIDEIMVCHCKTPSDGRRGCEDKCLNRMLNIECIQGTCPCGELCSNQQFQKHKYAKLKWFRCGKKGYGLQVVEDITEGQFLIEYVGEVLDMNAYEMRQREYALEGHKHFYFMTLNGSEVIDACAKGNLGRFINHSCDPNCRTEKWMVNGEVCVGLFALRDIKKGDELTFDYNYVRVFGAAAKKCVCGSPNCRGYIGGGGDPLNSEVIVHDDSDEEYPEPVMFCDDNEMNYYWNDVMKTSLNDREIKSVTETAANEDRMEQLESALSPLETASEILSSENLIRNEQTSVKSQVRDTVVHDVCQLEDSSAAAAAVHLDTNKETQGSMNRSASAGLKVESEEAEHSRFHVSTPTSLPRKLKAGIEGRDELAKSETLSNTRRSSSSVKKGKLKTNSVNDKKNPDVDKSHALPYKSNKLLELSLNSHVEAVEATLNELLNPDGGISKRKDASRGYLKLLFLTAASGNNVHGEAIQSNRDLSMILDALLKTKSRTVLIDIINKNGLQMLHNIMKRYRREFIKTPILRKLLKVLEYLAMREILNLENINGGPPRPGVESFRDSILTLTEHADKQVQPVSLFVGLCFSFSCVMGDRKPVITSDVIPVMSKITEHRLNGSNYLDWSKTVRLYLRSIDKDDHMTNDPPQDDSTQAWLREDARLFLQIRNSIDGEVISLINHCEFVKELLDYLEFIYSGKGNISRIYEVCKAFYRAEKQDKSLINYFMDFKRTYEELNMLMPYSADVKV